MSYRILDVDSSCVVHTSNVILVCTTRELSTSKILYDITRVYYTRTIYIQDSVWHYSCVLHNNYLHPRFCMTLLVCTTRDNQSHDLFDGSLLSNFKYRYLYLNTYLFTCIVNLIIFLWSSWVVLSCSRNWLCYWKLVSLRREVCDHKTSLTPSHFIEVYVPSHWPLILLKCMYRLTDH
jgi:hypothetical protein